jgi:hypothetical protein
VISIWQESLLLGMRLLAVEPSISSSTKSMGGSRPSWLSSI